MTEKKIPPVVSTRVSPDIYRFIVAYGPGKPAQNLRALLAEQMALRTPSKEN